MGIFTPKQHKVWEHAFKKELREFYGDKYTARQVLEHIFGDQDGHFTQYHLIYNNYDDVKTTKLQRLNLLWVWPCWFIIGSIKWIFTGDMGVSKQSKAVEILVKLIGNY